MDKKQLVTISILVKNRQANSSELQEILTKSGHLIMARMGINVEKSCVDNCTGLIILAVEGMKKDIYALIDRLEKLKGICVKRNLMN